MPAVHIVARSGRERRSADAPETDRGALVGAVIAVGDEAIAEVEDAHLRTLDLDEASPTGRKLVDPADGDGDAAAAQPAAAATFAGSPYQRRALPSKIDSFHSSRTGKKSGLSKSQCG